MSSKQQFILSFGLVSIVFILLVPATDVLVSFFITKNPLEDSNESGYSLKEVLAGVTSEIFRALITCYLYSTTIGKGSTALHGIKYGLLYSALIASLYIVLGGFYFQLKNPALFVIVDSLILLAQGVASGLVLYFVFRKPIRQIK